MTEPSAQLAEDQNAILRAQLDLQEAQLAAARAGDGRIDDLLNVLKDENKILRDALETALRGVQDDR